MQFHFKQENIKIRTNLNYSVYIHVVLPQYLIPAQSYEAGCVGKKAAKLHCFPKKAILKQQSRLFWWNQCSRRSCWSWFELSITVSMNPLVVLSRKGLQIQEFKALSTVEIGKYSHLKSWETVNFSICQRFVVCPCIVSSHTVTSTGTLNKVKIKSSCFFGQ